MPKVQVAHVVARPGEERDAGASFTCDDLHDIYNRVSALEDLLEDVLLLLIAWQDEVSELRRSPSALSAS